jgi:hypothetical protein
MLEGIDGTSTEMYKPGIEPQEHYYSLSRHYFIRTQVVITNDGKFESRSWQGVQHYVINFVSDLRQVGGFLQVLLLPPPIKMTATIELKY